MKSIKNLYSIPQEILYFVCFAAWKLCSDNLSKFSALKAIYTEAFVTAAVQVVQDARDLPTSRRAIIAKKKARINLITSTRQVRKNWQVLKVYITNAFEEKFVRNALEAAGSEWYGKASFDNWSAVRSLIDAANQFIASNLTELTANGNMPADFQTIFQTDGIACIDLSVVYAEASMTQEKATSVKVEANNTIYASVIKMLKDGQQIFTDDVLMKKQFTFSYLVSLYRGEGSASLKGRIVNNLNMPVEGAVIVSLDQKYTATTNDKGIYQINRIAAGTYTFTITCAGYNPLVQIITFAAGTASKGDFELVPAMMKVA